MCLCSNSDGSDRLGGRENVEDRVILPGFVVPKHYSVYLSTSFESWVYEGRVAISLDVKETTSKIVLNSKNLTISNATLSSGTSQETLSITFDTDAETVTFNFAEPLVSGHSATLTVVFSGLHKDQLSGFYRSSYTNEAGEKKYLVSTQCCATDARQCFPSFDEPALKATFDYTFSVDENLTVLTNTDEISSMPFVNAAGMKMKEVKFAVTPLMSTYLVAFVVGELDFIEATAVPTLPLDAKPIQLRVYTVKGASGQGSLALSVAKKTLEYFSEYFNIAYPLGKCDLVAIPDFSFGAMENWGLITYRTTALLCDERTATSSAKKRIAYTVAHELAHQWFGNLVTMKWWNDIWLNEGFATFVGWLAIDHLFPEWDIWTGYITEVLSGALGLDGLRSSHPIDVPVRIGSEALEVLDAISYKKGSSIIRMLNNFLGGDVFMNGVRSYLKEFQYKNAVTADLWRHLALSSGLDIPTLMQAWTDKTGYPLIIVESEVYDDEAKTLTVTLSQSRFLSGGELKPEEDAVTWWVPLTVATHLTGKSSESRVFSAKNGIITFPYDAAENSFWKLNVNGSGVYRVKYGNTQVANISRTLQLSLDNFTAGDRMMFVADAYALTSAGLGDIKNVLDLIQGMSKETDFNVLTQISSTLATLKSIAYKESALIRDGLKSLGKAVFSPLVKSLGFEFSVEEEYFTGQKRILAISVASGCGEEFVISELRSRFDKFIAGDLQALHPELRSTAYESALSNASADNVGETFTVILNIFKNPSTQPKEKSDILSVLGSVNSPEIVNRILNELMWDTSIVRTQDFVSPLVGVGGPGKNKTVLWQWFKENWSRFRRVFMGDEARLGGVFVASCGSLIGHDAIQEVEAWVAEKEKDLDEKKALLAFGRTIKQTVENMKTRTLLIERERGGLEHWISESVKL